MWWRTTLSMEERAGAEQVGGWTMRSGKSRTGEEGLEEASGTEGGDL